jgi:hypothetical protein
MPPKKRKKSSKCSDPCIVRHSSRKPPPKTTKKKSTQSPFKITRENELKERKKLGKRADCESTNKNSHAHQEDIDKELEEGVKRIINPSKTRIYNSIKVKTDYPHLKGNIKEYIFYNEYLNLITPAKDLLKEAEK